MKRFRLSTLILVVVIIALGVALVVQYDRQIRREAILTTRVEGMLVRWRDELAREIKADEAEYISLLPSLPRDDPKAQGLALRLRKRRDEFNSVVDRLKDMRRFLNRLGIPPQPMP